MFSILNRYQPALIILVLSTFIAAAIFAFTPWVHGVEAEQCFQHDTQTYCLQKHRDEELYLLTEQGTLPLFPYFKNITLVTAIDTLPPHRSISQHGYRVLREDDAVLFISDDHPNIQLPLTLIHALNEQIYTHFPGADMSRTDKEYIRSTTRMAILIGWIGVSLAIGPLYLLCN